MKFQWKSGLTDRTLLVFVQDSSVSTGAGKTGVTAAMLTARYMRVETDNDVTITTITMAALTALTDAHSDGGWFEIDATNAKGWYRFDIPDGALAAGAWSVGINLQDAGSNNIAPVPIEIQLTGIDVEDGVRAGMTSLPNAAAAANGGVPTVDANNAVKIQTGTGANQLDVTSGVVKANLKQIDEQATNGNNATLRLKQLNIVNNGGDALFCHSTGSGNGATFRSDVTGGHGAHFFGTSTTSDGLKCTSGSTGIDLNAPKITGNITGNLSGSIGSLGATAKTDVITAVWTTAATRTLTSFGTLVADITAGIWDALLTGIVAVGSIGKLLKDNIDAAISSRASASALATAQADLDSIEPKVDSIQSDTNDIQARLPATLSAGRMRAQVEGIEDVAMDAFITRDNQRDVDLDAAGAAKQSKAMAILKQTSRVHADETNGTVVTYRKDGTTPALTQAQTTSDTAKPVTDIGVGA